MEILNLDDVYFILESLNYTKLAFEDYPIYFPGIESNSIGGGFRGYFSVQQKQGRLNDVGTAISKVRELRDKLKKEKRNGK